MTDKDISYDGIYILKIILALMVISIHFMAPATGHALQECDNSIIKLVFAVISVLSVPAVNTYVLITAFFSYKEKRAYGDILSKLSKLWIAMVMYSVFGYIFTCIIEYQQFKAFEFIKRLFPIVRSEWWFMSVYFALILSSPFLIKLINSISARTHRRILICSLVFCSILPFFTKWEEDFGIDCGYSYIWFAVLFLVGSYLARIDIVSRINAWVCLLGTVLCGMFTLAVTLLSTRIDCLQGYTVHVYNSLVVAIQSVFLFCLFLKFRINMKWKKALALIASLSMASYLLHDQEDISTYFWTTTNPGKYADSYKILLVFSATIFGLYFLSIIIEFLRRQLVRICGLETKISIAHATLLGKILYLIDNRLDRIDGNVNGE